MKKRGLKVEHKGVKRVGEGMGGEGRREEGRGGEKKVEDTRTAKWDEMSNVLVPSEQQG